MLREKIMGNNGKFFLRKKTRYGVQYLREKGVYDVGTPNESHYAYWTDSMDFAQGFKTIKAAKAMQVALMEDRGMPTVIVKRDGMVI